MHVQRLVQGAATFARLQTPRLRLVWSGLLPSQEDVQSNQITGIIYFALPDGAEKQLEQMGVPMVSVSSRNLPTAHASVTPDDSAIGQMAARHFKENLFENFAYIGLREHRYGVVRGESFAEGIFPSVCQHLWLDAYPNPDAAHEAIKSFLRALPRPTAILAANDIFARRICEIAIELGFAVPEDLAILGVDAEQMVSLSSPVDLSSVDIDSFKIGYTAAEVLCKLIEDPAMAPPQIQIPPKGILVAASTDHLATTDPIVASAVSHIRQHACGGLTVDEMASALGVGRRMLERRFRKAIGKGVDEIIRKVRIERSMEMLERSDLPIGEIAERCGFADIFYFSKFFKRATGQSPREFRSG